MGVRGGRVPSGMDLHTYGDSWPGGAADCTAMLYTTTDGRRLTTLATLGFYAYE